MNCKHIRQHLCEGRLLTGPAADHLQTCAGCRTMMETLQPSGELPSRQRLDLVIKSIQESLQPVHPLPSSQAMILLSLGIFLIFSVFAAALTSFGGFEHLTAMQRAWYYGTIITCAVLFSVGIVEEIIPGAKRYVSAGAIISASLTLIAAVAIALFPSFDLTHFVRQGLPCLRLGSICAAIGGLIAYFLIGKGSITFPIKLCLTAGFFAGLAGVAVLALYCPLQNTAHIVVWHLGVMILGGLAGLISGTCLGSVSASVSPGEWQ